MNILQRQFLQHLKHRKLVQWAVAYVAAAFALLQGIDIIAQRFGWPEQTMRFVIIVLSLGFFFTLVLAWFHGERGAQRVTGTELLILALLLAIGTGVLWRFVGMSRNRVLGSDAPPAATASSPGPAAIPEKSIAVLPFENLSVEKDNAFFADGIQDEILTGLAKIGDLKVISRTSTQGYGSRPQNLAEIGRQLGVSHVLEGSVQKAGNSVRVNVQLIDTTSDNHRWAETYDRTLEDVFGVETEVAQKIASSLQAQLTRDERAALTKKPTNNPEAYEAYLKARTLLLGSSYNRVNSERVLDSLQTAVKLDPGFAEAWAQLSITNAWIYWSGFDPTPSRLATAESALDQAAALAPDLPRAAKARALYLYFGKRDFTASLNIWRSLQHRLPNDDEVWYFSALLERRLGLFDAAVADFGRARLLNPNGVVFATELGLTLFLLHHFQEAVPVLDAGLAWQPDDPSLLMLRLYCAWNLDGIAGGKKVLAQVKSDGPAVIGLRALQALFERDYKTATTLFRRAIASNDDSLLPISLNGYVPANVEWQLLLALSEQRDGSPAAAAESYRQVQARAQAALSEPQGNRNVEAAWYVALAWADAGLGRRDQAVGAAQRATALIPEAADTLEGPAWQEFLAKTYAMNGDADHAVPLIEHLLQSEVSLLSPGILQLDPVWDPIKDDTRFRELLKRPKLDVYLPEPDRNK
jgi:TolB-like protein